MPSTSTPTLRLRSLMRPQNGLETLQSRAESANTALL